MSTQKQQTVGPTEAELMAGYSEVAVYLLEESQNVERVKVLLLPVKSFPELLRVNSSGDEVAKIELLTKKPKNWVESLRPDSHETIILVGERLNSDFFARWESRQPKQDLGTILDVISKLPAPVAEQLIEKFAKAGQSLQAHEAQTGNPSSSGSPKPKSSAG